MKKPKRQVSNKHKKAVGKRKCQARKKANIKMGQNNTSTLKDECVDILSRNGVGSGMLNQRPTVGVNEGNGSKVGAYKTEKDFIDTDGAKFAKDFDVGKKSPVVVYVKNGKNNFFVEKDAQDILDRADQKLAGIAIIVI